MDILAERLESWRADSLMLPIWWEEGSLFLIDQRALPFERRVVEIPTVERLAEAIVYMEIRGSGAIGIAGAYGMLLAATTDYSPSNMQRSAKLLQGTRPTAINLFKTIEEILAVDEDLDAIRAKVVEILDRQLAFERALGAHGAALFNDGDAVLTHCHSGAHAGSGYGGRALSVIRAAAETGKKIHVYVSETRPYLQGARITAYELEKLGIPHTLITDSMSGYLMGAGKVQRVVVGSDRVANNGDLANKIGTYTHALVAHYHNVPFYTATSSHTIDFGIDSGVECPIEFRDPEEVKRFAGQAIALPETEALYPAFDITPNELIAGIITEAGVITAPYTENLKQLQSQGEER